MLPRGARALRAQEKCAADSAGDEPLLLDAARRAPLRVRAAYLRRSAGLRLLPAPTMSLRLILLTMLMLDAPLDASCSHFIDI